MKIYTIKDNKAGTFNTPFFQLTDVHAVRAFRAEVNRMHEQNMIYLYPQEFDLVDLGEFDQLTGEIKHNQVTLMVNGLSLKDDD